MLAVLVAVVVVWSLPGEREGYAQSEAPSPVVVFKLQGASDEGQRGGELTATIREVVEGEAAFELVNDDPVVLSDVVVILGCESPNAPCLAKAAEHFEADYLIFSTVESTGGEARVTVRLFDRAESAYVRRVERKLAETTPPDEEFRREIRRLLDPGSVEEGEAARGEPSATNEDGEADQAVLEVEASVEGARVEIDGEPAGRAPVERSGISPGSYRVRVRKSGYAPWTTVVQLEAGARVQIRAPLQKQGASAADARDEDRERAEASEADAPKGEPSASGGEPSVDSTPSGAGEPSQPPPSERSSAVAEWGPWVTLGLGGVALIGSGLEAMRMRQAQSDLIDWRERHPPSVRTSCPSTGSRECELLERGEQAQLTHRVLLGVGGASAVAGGLWLLFREGQSESRGTRRAWSLQVSGRGIGATWRW